jgi:selenide,water dikinase
MEQLPLLSHVKAYQELGCIPGGTHRNFDSYGHKAQTITEEQKQILCDPQTSGGLLVAVDPEAEADFFEITAGYSLELNCIGDLVEQEGETLVSVAD